MKKRLVVIVVLIVCLAFTACVNSLVTVKGQVTGIKTIKEGELYKVSFHIIEINEKSYADVINLWEPNIQTMFSAADVDKLSLDQIISLTCRWNSGYFGINDDSCVLKSDELR